MTGSREWAFGALRVAAGKHDHWARHHHLYGLIHEVSGDSHRGLMELERSRAVRQGPATQGPVHSPSKENALVAPEELLALKQQRI